MTLLRVADYLQIQPERAPEQLHLVRRIKSPISEGEWKVHASVRNIHLEHDDPEAIAIDALPPDVTTYLKMKAWLTGIQTELDSCWAVLGEVYGRFHSHNIDQLGLLLRRVRSNLDDESTFAKSVNYVPCNVIFDVANADLLKLLVGPLYGQHPQVGVREMVQNAVDAVLEIQDYKRKHPAASTSDLRAQEADVLVTLQQSNGEYWITVADRGIGMTIHVIRDYFLKAGASLRKSNLWRDEFEDENNNSRVLRSGRFGVGALAAFLLGDQIEVETRHITASMDEGFKFSAKLSDTVVELHNTRCPIGTSIRVRMPKDRYEYLVQNPVQWDWFCLKDPKVVRIVNGKKALKQKHKVPSPQSKMPAGWRRISHPQYSDIHWTYNKAPQLVCNGIEIKELYVQDWWEYGRNRHFSEILLGGRVIEKPNISVFDPDGNLPLDLQRTTLTQGELPFHNEFLEDLCKDIIAFCLVNAPSEPVHRQSAMYHWPNCIHPAFDNEYGPDFWPWFSTSEGISFFDDALLHLANLRTALVLPPYLHLLAPDEMLSNKDCGIFKLSDQPSQSTHLSIYHPSTNAITECMDFNPKSSIIGKRLFLSRSLAEKILQDEEDIDDQTRSHFRRVFGSNKNSFLKQTNSNKGIDWESKDWVVWGYGECPSTTILNYAELAEAATRDQLDVNSTWTMEWYFAEHQKEITSPLSVLWNDLIGSAFIPLDSKERRKKLSRAYKELSSYIAYHEAKTK